jgi:hypothetical protein
MGRNEIGLRERISPNLIGGLKAQHPPAVQARET